MPMELQESAHVVFRPCVFPAAVDLEGIRTRLSGEELPAELIGVSQDRQQRYALLICHKSAQEDAVNLRPDVLSILVGINDVGFTMWEQSGSGPERFGRIYQLLLDEARAANPALLTVMMEPFVMPVGDRKDTYQDWLSLLRPLQEQTRLIAERNGAIFIPLQERFNALCQVREASYWVWDGIHPTVSGHQVIADAWMEAVGSALGLTDHERKD